MFFTLIMVRFSRYLTSHWGKLEVIGNIVKIILFLVSISVCVWCVCVCEHRMRLILK